MRAGKCKILLTFAGLLYMAGSMAYAEDFPAWMDEVEFKSSSSSEFQLNGPMAPIDPETGSAATIESSKTSQKFNKPKLPDFSKLREKAIKSTTEKRASDTLSLQHSIEFSAKNRDRLVKNRDDLQNLLKTITDPVEKERLSEEKELLDKKINAAAQLLQLINSEKGNLAGQLSQLSESDFNQAMQLQQLIFGRPSQQKFVPPKARTIKKQEPARQFYKPTSRFKSFFIESKQKAAEESELED
jgi:uncharacterized phage infection (PIP) family protein YhgE